MMDIGALREIAAAATPGPWEYSGHDSGYDTVRAWPQLVVCDAMDNGGPDATFIATFDPQMVGALLDEVDRLRADRDWWRDRAIKRDPLLELVEVSEDAGLYDDTPQ